MNKQSLNKRKKIVRKKFKEGLFKIKWRSEDFVFGKNVFKDYYKIYDNRLFSYIITKEVDNKAKLMITHWNQMLTAMKRGTHGDNLGWYTILEEEFESLDEAKEAAQEWHLNYCAVFYRGKI